MALFAKELKRVFLTIPYLLMTFVLLIVGISQGIFLPEDTLEQPQPGLASYGSKAGNDPDKIMPAAVQALYGDFASNHFIAYPIGFYKNVRLTEAKQWEMAGILHELTGLSTESLLAAAKGEKPEDMIFSTTSDRPSLSYNKDGTFSIPVPEEGMNGVRDIPFSPGPQVSPAPDLTYGRFLELMEQADNLIGGGSSYSAQYIRSSFGQEPVAYEEALADYQLTVEKDQLTGAHARLFSDYFGIFLAILPVFPAVAYLMADKKDIRSSFYSRRISSIKLLGVRWAALITATLLPVFLMGVCLTFFHMKQYAGLSIDHLAYFKYLLGWLLPTVMMSTAVGFFFTLLTGTPLAIAVQGVWWFYSIMVNAGSLTGNYSYNLVPRHNSLGSTQIFLDSFEALAANRIGYALASILLFALCVLVLEQKRKGRLDVRFNLGLRNRKS